MNNAPLSLLQVYRAPRNKLSQKLLCCTTLMKYLPLFSHKRCKSNFAFAFHSTFPLVKILSFVFVNEKWRKRRDRKTLSWPSIGPQKVEICKGLSPSKSTHFEYSDCVDLRERFHTAISTGFTSFCQPDYWKDLTGTVLGSFKLSWLFSNQDIPKRKWKSRLWIDPILRCVSSGSSSIPKDICLQFY